MEVKPPKTYEEQVQYIKKKGFSKGGFTKTHRLPARLGRFIKKIK